jgi:hypothetical protein
MVSHSLDGCPTANGMQRICTTIQPHRSGFHLRRARISMPLLLWLLGVPGVIVIILWITGIIGF